MQIPLYQIDAFTNEAFGGNPAAVCPLDAWLDDGLMQAIAAENNLAETAFFVPDGDGCALRWFTPVLEVDLCGHATLASAYVLLEYLRPGLECAAFSTRSGILTVTRAGDRLVMDFPAWRAERMPIPPGLSEVLGAPVREVYRTRDLLLVLDSGDQVRSLRPDIPALARFDCLGVIVTAPGGEADFVSRFFAPRAGIAEDPVTGSAHSTLAPFWAERLGKTRLTARQLSARGGELWCDVRGDRVTIAGQCVPYLQGTITVPG